MSDPERDDAALVYRYLRDHGRASLMQIVEARFPVVLDAPESTVKAVRKRSVGRVLGAVDWMRGQGVVVLCHSVPGFDSEFSLGDVMGG